MSTDLKQRLVESLQLLAMSASEVKKLFPKYVVIPDELALMFDESLKLNEYYKDIPELVKIDKILSLYSGKRYFWTDESLENNKKWGKIRELAKSALVKIGAKLDKLDKPKLNWITFVKG